MADGSADSVSVSANRVPANWNSQFLKKLSPRMDYLLISRLPNYWHKNSPFHVVQCPSNAAHLVADGSADSVTLLTVGALQMFYIIIVKLSYLSRSLSRSSLTASSACSRATALWRIFSRSNNIIRRRSFARCLSSQSWRNLASFVCNCYTTTSYTKHIDLKSSLCICSMCCSLISLISQSAL